MKVKEFDFVISAKRLERNYWKDVWRHKDLFYILAWRDIKVRYKQTILGVAWSILQPLFTMLVFTFIFSKVAHLPSEGEAPYAIMVFAAMIPWQFFSNAVRESSNSLIANERLVTKVYFPRIIIPSSTLIVSLIDMLISLGILALLMLYFGYYPDKYFLLLPFYLLLLIVFSFSIGLFFASFNVKYRDVRYIIPFILQAGLYISPVGFSSTIIPEKYHLIYGLNPMVGVIEGFRKCILGAAVAMDLWYLLSSIIFTIIFFILSIRYFQKTEKKFADII